MNKCVNIIIILVVLISSVQPRLVLHFCGEKFITTYINKNPDSIQNGCIEYLDSNCKGKDLKSNDKCANRKLIAIDISTDIFTQHDLFNSNTSFFKFDPLFIEDSSLIPYHAYSYLFYGTSPPYKLCQITGRDILIHNCTFLI